MEPVILTDCTRVTLPLVFNIKQSCLRKKNLLSLRDLPLENSHKKLKSDVHIHFDD